MVLGIGGATDGVEGDMAVRESLSVLVSAAVFAVPVEVAPDSVGEAALVKSAFSEIRAAPSVNKWSFMASKIWGSKGIALCI